MAGELTTTNYGWVKPTVGSSTDAWGGLLNTDLDGIDSTVKSVSNAIPAASSTTPVMDGSAAVGTGTTWARADHVHPSDTTLLPKAGGVMTGALTPSSTVGIVGTTTNDNANAGAIGEVISANVTTPITLTNSTPLNVASIALTAGDWDVNGEVWFVAGATAPAGMQIAINNVTAAMPAASSIGTARFVLYTTLSASFAHIFPLRACRVSLSAPATYFLVARMDFSAGTCTAAGSIWARRAR